MISAGVDRQTDKLAGEPKLLAELPPQDENACAFFIEWRTHVRFYYIAVFPF
jgi:hypothetical protein